jgi:putative DNA primase/helicase
MANEYFEKVVDEVEKRQQQSPEEFREEVAARDPQAMEAWKRMGMLGEKDANEVASDVLRCIAKGLTQEASEIVTSFFEKNRKIFTLRSDVTTEMWIYSEGVFIPEGQTAIKEFCREILGEAYTTHFANEVIAKIETDTYISAEDFFKEENTDEICIANGILNLKTKKLSEYTSDKKFLNKILVNFNAEAKCPNIEAFFDSVFKNPDDKQIIWEIIGNCLLRDYRFGKAVMCCGSGSNGKSVFLNLLKHFLGHKNCVNIPLQEFELNQFALCSLHTKLANLGGEISNVSLKTTGAFKKLTGQDIISADRKFLTRLHFGNYCKQLFSTNELPITYDLTPAFFRRWIIIDFPFKFFSQKEIDKMREDDKANCKLADPELISKLTTPEELSGLLNKALEGLANLMTTGDFSYSKSISEVKDMWICKADSFLAFCLANIHQDPEGAIPKDELRRRYNDYCVIMKQAPKDDKHIYKVLTEQYGSYTWTEFNTLYENNIQTKTAARHWKGIKYNNVL